MWAEGKFCADSSLACAEQSPTRSVYQAAPVVQQAYLLSQKNGEGRVYSVEGKGDINVGKLPIQKMLNESQFKTWVCSANTFTPFSLASGSTSLPTGIMSSLPLLKTSQKDGATGKETRIFSSLKE